VLIPRPVCLPTPRAASEVEPEKPPTSPAMAHVYLAGAAPCVPYGVVEAPVVRYAGAITPLGELRYRALPATRTHAGAAGEMHP